MRKKSERREKPEKLLPEDVQKTKTADEKSEVLESFAMMPFGLKYTIRSRGNLRTYTLLRGSSGTPMTRF